MSSPGEKEKPIPTGFYHEYEFGEDSSSVMKKSPRSMYKDYMDAAIQSTKREFPRFSSHEALYTSTASVLKKTRKELEEYAKDLGVVQAVMDLPTGADVRRLVARIFADPKAADAISESEWRRREQLYQLSREKMGEKLNAHLRKEREVLQKELELLSGPPASPQGSSGK
jgi:uncharacterized protein YqiB (DUF1249 family)